VPTFETTDRFAKDLALLSVEGKARFKAKVLDEFVPDLEAGKFRAGLRVKKVQGTDGVMEMSWAPDGRATWQYGAALTIGKPHVIWRRIGTHDIFRSP
jgi:hypothetical protein